MSLAMDCRGVLRKCKIRGVPPHEALSGFIDSRRSGHNGDVPRAAVLYHGLAHSDDGAVEKK
jgi:hypothetical protein